MTPDEKKKALDKIAHEVMASGGGPLKAPGVNAVPGEGDPDARVMFIGEAPGFYENEQGRPFVGQAGQLLRKNLRENGLREEKVYITNIVKYRPPENRDPGPEEIEYFSPFLDRQIGIISPDIIVTLGRFSLYKFLGEGVSISKIHGQPRFVDWQGVKTIIFPMFHPAAALRDGKVMEQFKEDFRKLREIANGKQIAPIASVQTKAEQLELI